MTKQSDDCGVGYDKPPHESRFRKGQSGNPAGRPRRKRKEVEFPGIDPTREFIRTEASRAVTIREGQKKLSIPTTQAVMRSLGVKAMQGGVLAARTFLEHQLREDALIRAEREKKFNIWQGYIERTQAMSKQAADRGDALPEPIPHPDDVQLDYGTLEVRFLGPIDEVQQRDCMWLKEQADLYFELMLLCGESEYGIPTAD